jgi:hypothetical protein
LCALGTWTLFASTLRASQCLARQDGQGCIIQHGDGVDVNCAELNLTSIPTSLPRDVTNLDLSENLISDVSNDGVLRHYDKLRVLNLSDNVLQSIDWRALPHSLQTLRLSRNDITRVCLHRGERLCVRCHDFIC